MKYIAALVIILFSLPAFAFPQPVGHVNDFAGILPGGQAIGDQLSAYEKNTTIQIAVVTIDALSPDQSTATYAVELFQQWGIGQKGEDNGVLVLIVENGTTGNRMRIELGYGIQGYITGAESGRILDRALPYYTQGDYQQAAQTIVDGIILDLKDYVPGNPAPKNDYTPLAGGAAIFIISYFPLIIFVVAIGLVIYAAGRCPYCRSRKIICEDDYCKCQNCGRRFKRKRNTPVFFFFGGVGGSSGGGFGGGSSGGGGAGR